VPDDGDTLGLAVGDVAGLAGGEEVVELPLGHTEELIDGEVRRRRGWGDVTIGGIELGEGVG
jgi:hypothetical protein